MFILNPVREQSRSFWPATTNHTCTPPCSPLLSPRRPVQHVAVLYYLLPDAPYHAAVSYNWQTSIKPRGPLLSWTILYPPCSPLQPPTRPVTVFVFYYHPADIDSILWSSTITCTPPCDPLLSTTYLYPTLWSSTSTYQTCNSHWSVLKMI